MMDYNPKQQKERLTMRLCGLTHCEKLEPVKQILLALVLFVLFAAIYVGDGEFLMNNDVTANLYMPVNVLEGNGLAFSPERFPFMFRWQANLGNGPVEGSVQRWEENALAARQQGMLTLLSPKYYLVPTQRPGAYANFFGAGAGLTAFPFIAVARMIAPDIGSDTTKLWTIGRWLAAGFAAGAVIFVFLAALALSGRKLHALLIALAFGLGTCVWSSCSQDYSQQTPNIFFLALGTWLFAISHRGWVYAALSGAVYAWAAWCRPTSALVVIAVAGYFCFANRRNLIAFVIGALPFAIGLALYNIHYFGSPFTFGQMVGAVDLALNKTGRPEPWQTPLYVGLPGILLSPSRGLFVYSPFLLFALWGTVRVWRDRQLAIYRPLTLAALAILLVQAKHFDWWGGWSFGYRHIIDVTVFGSLLLIPLMETLRHRKILIALFAMTLVLSIGVHALGVTAYDMVGWNDRATGDKSTSLDVDKPENRHRLWSVSDSQLVYYTTHFHDAHANRHRTFEQWMQTPVQ